MLKLIEKKINQSIDIIQKGLQYNCYFACSFGKDSIVLFHLLYDKLKLYDIPCIWFNGGEFDEFPETINYINKILKLYKKVNFIEIKPKIIYKELLKQYGLANNYSGKIDKIYDKYFSLAFEDYMKENNKNATIWGVTAAESRIRKLLFLKKGTIYQLKNNNYRISPLAWWFPEDIWIYIDYYKITYHPIYDKTLFQDRNNIRLGIMFTGVFHNKGNILFIKKYYSEYYNKFLKEFPEIKLNQYV